MRAMAPIDRGIISFLASPHIRLLLLEAESPFLPFLADLSRSGIFSVIINRLLVE